MKQKEIKKLNKGITLIALVITIIVLLILAGVSIAMLTGENGILSQANKSKIEQSHGAIKEALSLAYNEYQIEINTASTVKVASKETVTIKGEEEKAESGITKTFLQFLEDKGYIRDGSTDVLNVETLTGSKQVLGNGTNTDIYKIEEENGKYIVNYYDEKGTPEQIWNISNTTNTEIGDLTLEPDTGKEALILVYNVLAGDKIGLPYDLEWYDDKYNKYDATFNFDIDWGDGNTTESITNANIKEKAIHQYETSGTYEVKIEGKYEVLYSYSLRAIGIEDLVEIKQWGITNLKSIQLLDDAQNLTKIAQPTENSFKNLVVISFRGAKIESIPKKLFANCPNLTNLDSIFSSSKITNIPESLFANCPNIIDVSSAFYNTPITSIPENLFANCKNINDFSNCFSQCENLTGKAPELWLRVPNGEKNKYIGVPNGNFCFEGCINLDNYEEIPPYWRDEGIPQ